MSKTLSLCIMVAVLLGCSRSNELTFDYRVNPPEDVFLAEYFGLVAASSGILYVQKTGAYYTTDTQSRDTLVSLRQRIESAGSETIELDVPNGCILSWFTSHLLEMDAVFLVRASEQATTPVVIASPEFEGTKLQSKYLEIAARCQDGT
ncbi:hypothetical protein GCM10027297_26400 [Parahaliea aestuarii]